MSVFRVERTKNYTVMSNTHLRDPKLSLKSKGLLSIMLSLPDDWDYTIGGLARLNGVGKDTIRSAVSELEDAGYIKRQRGRTEGGKFSSNDYIVYESPEQAESSCENAESPSLEKPTLENPTQQNTNIPSTNLLSTYPPIVPPQGTAAESIGQASLTSDMLFDRFWSVYPNGKGKQAAKKAWDKLKPNLSLCQQMSNALKWQVKTWEWTHDQGRYIPRAATWLNQRLWEENPDAYRPAEDAPTRDPQTRGMVEREEVPLW